MYKRVLVPLDGSELAEAILPFAAQVAGPLDAQIVLLRVVPPVSTAQVLAAGGVVAPETLSLREMEAKQYLQATEQRLGNKGLRVRSRIAHGPPAEAILAAVQTSGADLIAMTTHGRSGLGRALFGSVAESVLRASSVPVLLMRPPGKRQPSPEPVDE